MNDQYRRLEELRLDLGLGTDRFNDKEALDFIFTNYGGYASDFTKDFYDKIGNDNVSNQKLVYNEPEPVSNEWHTPILKRMYNDVAAIPGGFDGLSNSFVSGVFNNVTNKMPQFFGSVGTFLLNPEGNINNLEKFIAEQRLLLDDPKHPDTNPYEKTEAYDSYTGLPNTYTKKSDGSSVAENDWLMQELRSIGLGDEMQRPKSVMEKFSDDYNRIYGYRALEDMLGEDLGGVNFYTDASTSKEEIKNNISILERELKDQKESLANPTGIMKSRKFLFNQAKDWANNNRIASEEYVANKMRTDMNYMLYKNWQEDEPTEFKFGKDVTNSSEMSGVWDVPFTDYKFTSNVLHPAIMVREFTNFAESIVSTAGAGTGAKLGLRTLGWGASKAASKNFLKKGILDVKSLGYTDQLFLTALSGGHAYESTYATLKEMGLSDEDASVLAAEASFNQGIVEGALERVGLKATFGHLGKDLKSDWAKSFARNRYSQYLRTKAQDAVKKIPLVGWLVSKPLRTAGGLSVGALGEAMTESYQSAWEVAQAEAIKQGYGTDPMNSMDNLFTAVLNEVGTDPRNYLMPIGSDIDEITSAFGAGLSGGLGMGAFGRVAKTAGMYGEKVYTAMGDDVVGEKDKKTGAIKKFFTTAKGKNKTVANVMAQENGGIVEYKDPFTVEDYAISVANLLEDMRDNPMIEDLVTGRLAITDELNEIEKYMKKHQKETNPADIAGSLMRYLVNNTEIKNTKGGITAFIDSLDISDKAKDRLMREARKSRKKKAEVTIKDKLGDTAGSEELKLHIKNAQNEIDNTNFDELIINGFDKDNQAAAEQQIFNSSKVPVSVMEGDPDAGNVISSTGASIKESEGAIDEQDRLEKKQFIAEAKKRVGTKTIDKLKGPGDVIDYFMVKMGHIDSYDDFDEMMKDIVFLDKNRTDTLAQAFKGMGNAETPADFVQAIGRLVWTEAQAEEISKILAEAMPDTEARNQQEPETKKMKVAGGVRSTVLNMPKDTIAKIVDLLLEERAVGMASPERSGEIRALLSGVEEAGGPELLSDTFDADEIALNNELKTLFPSQKGRDKAIGFIEDAFITDKEKADADAYSMGEIRTVIEDMTEQQNRIRMQEKEIELMRTMSSEELDAYLAQKKRDNLKVVDPTSETASIDEWGQSDTWAKRVRAQAAYQIAETGMLDLSKLEKPEEELHHSSILNNIANVFVKAGIVIPYKEKGRYVEGVYEYDVFGPLEPSTVRPSGSQIFQATFPKAPKQTQKDKDSTETVVDPTQEGPSDDEFNAMLADQLGMTADEVADSINAQKEQEAQNEAKAEALEKANKEGENIVKNKICITKDN